MTKGRIRLTDGTQIGSPGYFDKIMGVRGILTPFRDHYAVHRIEVFDKSIETRLDTKQASPE